MNIEVLKQEKNEVEFNIDNLTVAEILRVYLQEHADFAAWRRDHPFKPLTMRIESSNVKKAVADSVEAIKKDLDVLVKGIKK